MTIDNVDSNLDLEKTIDNVAIYHLDNDHILQIGNISAIDVNENANNADECTSSDNESLPSQLCVPLLMIKQTTFVLLLT